MKPGETTTLVALVDALRAARRAGSAIDPGLVTIYARPPWAEGSDAIALSEGQVPPPGLVYVLEGDLVEDVLTTWSSWRSDRVPSSREAVDAVTHYARFDAYLPVD